jgi:Phage-related protein
VTVGLLERVAAARGGDEQRFSVDAWLSDFLLPANTFGFNNQQYPFGLNQTWPGGPRSKEISNTLPGYMNAIRQCPPAFGAQLVRASVLSQARFTFRNRSSSSQAGKLFGTRDLAPLEQPWPNATTGQLINIMEWHEGLAGNAYVTNRTPGRLRVLRPDWVVIIYGSEQQPDDAAHALDGQLIGYGYCNGGIAQNKYPIEILLPDEVAHWSPQPDPECAGIGMSWITPAVREIQGDKAATDHKLRFFENGATPNMVVKGMQAATKEQFEEMVDAMETRHAGVRNAYRTLYLTAGADATVVGADLKQLDFKATQGAGETRISMLSRVHPVVLGASEGMQGSSLNAGNFGAARRLWADTWIYPTLADLAASLAPLVKVPGGAELWTNTADMPILREDAIDAAQIEQTKAATIVSLSTGGFTRESAIAAVMGQDMTLLVKDPNWVSVQLQQSNGQTPPETPPAVAGNPPKKALPPGGQS